MELPIIHHQAATGGTIISKCISQMPNVRLLSEVDPAGRMSRKISFEPTALISQYFSQYGELDRNLINEYFLTQLKLIIDFVGKRKLSLVLRDHNHPDYMMGVMVNSRPLISLVLNNKEYLGVESVNSVVTIRHPIDSFLGCKRMNWTAPIGHVFDTYCDRLLSFSEAYSGSKIFKYEEFCIDPDTVLKSMCDHLNIDYDIEYKDKISDIRLTGDSGRSSSKISLRERRSLEPDFIEEVKNSESFIKYCQLHDYDSTVM